MQQSRPKFELVLQNPVPKMITRHEKTISKPIAKKKKKKLF